MKHADVVETGLAIEYCGFVGTAAGFLLDIFIACAFGVTGSL